MPDQLAPLPPPQPNDGSLNTELPIEQPVTNGPSFKKRIGILAVLGIVAAAGIFYTVATYPQKSDAEGGKKKSGIVETMRKTATPTAVITQTEEQELESIDLGDIDADMRDIENDLNLL